jgi:hypothetical protein
VPFDYMAFGWMNRRRISGEVSRRYRKLVSDLKTFKFALSGTPLFLVRSSRFLISCRRLLLVLFMTSWLLM